MSRSRNFSETVWNSIARAANDDVIESFGVEPLEANAIFEPGASQELAYRLAFAAAEDVMDLRAKSVRADGERVCVAAGDVVRLDDEDAASLCSEERARGEAAHAGTDDEIVERAQSVTNERASSFMRDA